MTMSKSIKISILVPIYGVEKYIEQCVHSLFRLNYQNIEYVFVNDCTKDNSIQLLENIIKLYPQREKQVHIINHETNRGLAASRLTGLQKSTGDYVWFVDSDDYVKEDAIDRCFKYIDEEYDLIQFSYTVKEAQGETDKILKKVFSIDNVLAGLTPPMIWKCFIKRSLFFENDIYPIEGINHSEDYVLLARLRLVASKVISLNDQQLYVYNLTNVNSYMNNISLNSVVNTVQGCIHVYDFYKSKNKVKNHKKAMLSIFLRRWIELTEKDYTNKYCVILSNRIKEIFSILGFILESLKKIHLNGIAIIIAKISKKICDYFVQ